MPQGSFFLSQYGYAVNGIPCSNTFIWQAIDVPDQVDETADLNIAMNTDLVPKIQAIQSVETTLCFIKSWIIQEDLPPAMALLVDAFGDVVGSAAVANKNMKIQLRQSTMGVRTNGELRIAGIPETDTTGNSYIGLINRPVQVNALVNQLVSGIVSPIGAGQNWLLHVASSGLEAQAAGPIPAYNEVTSASVGAYVNSDRRRTSRHMSVFSTP